MFNLSEWLVAGIIDGYRKGHTPFVKVTEMTAAYLGKGFISEAQAEEIAVACPVPAEETVIEENVAEQETVEA